MPLTAAQITTDINQLHTDVGKLHDIVHGTDTDTVSTDNGPVDSVAKFYADVLAAIGSGSFPGTFTGLSRTITGADNVVAGDNGKTILCDGSTYYKVTLPDPTTLPTPFVVCVKNIKPDRRSDVAVFGFSEDVEMYPTQSTEYIKTSGGWVLKQDPGQWKIDSDRTFFTSDAGVSTNDGLADTSPLPLQDCITRVLQDVQCQGNAHVVIQHADGTMPDNVTVVDPIEGAIYITIQGNPADATAVLQSVGSAQIGFYVKHRGFVKLKHLTTAGVGATALVWADRNGGVDLYDIIFGSTDGGVMLRATEGGSVEFADVCFFAGNAAVAVTASMAGRMAFSGFVHQFLVDCNFSVAFALASEGGTIFANPGGSFNLNGHGVGGLRVIAVFGGSVLSADGTTTFYPGTSFVAPTTGYYQ